MPRRSGRPSKGEDNPDSRKKIIDAAVTLIRTKGADAVTVRSVCREADLSIGTFYHYFRDKDDLMMFFLRETSFDGFSLHIQPATVPSLLIWGKRMDALLRKQ